MSKGPFDSLHIYYEVFSIYGLRNFGFKNHCKSFYFGTPKIFITVTIFGVTIFGVTIFGGIIFDVTIFEITKEIPLKFKLGFLCVLSRPSAIKVKIMDKGGFKRPTSGYVGLNLPLYHQGVDSLQLQYINNTVIFTLDFYQIIFFPNPTPPFWYPNFFLIFFFKKFGIFSVFFCGPRVLFLFFFQKIGVFTYFFGYTKIFLIFLTKSGIF